MINSSYSPILGVYCALGREVGRYLQRPLGANYTNYAGDRHQCHFHIEFKISPTPFILGFSILTHLSS